MSIIQSASDLHPVGSEVLLPYTAAMTDTIRQWRQHLLHGGFTSEWFTDSEISTWLDRIYATTNALKFRFLFDPTDQLYVDLLASGFPHRYNIRTLDEETLPAMSAGEEREKRLELKRAFLDDMRKRKQANSALLHEISLTHAHEMLNETGPMQTFHLVSLREVQSDEVTSTRKQYVCVWERFGYRNTPALYSLYFETDGNLDDAMVSHLAVVLEEETSDLVRMKPLVERIDQSSTAIHPKVFCRIILGPVFINGFTMDDNPLQGALNKMGSEMSTVTASRIIHECIISVGETEMGNLNDPHGNKIAVLQDFAVRELDSECKEREASKVEKFLFAPHRVIQALDETWRQEINHTFIST